MPLRFLALPAMLLALAVAPAAAQSRGLTLGFYDKVFSTDEGGTWLDRAQESGAGLLRVEVIWNDVAPVRPDAPADPADPAYRWQALDASVAAAHARGLQVMLSFGIAPKWAEGANRPEAQRPGSWKPSAKATGQFATALARRFATQAQYVQVFNEPNLPIYLAPQWERRRGKLRAFAPARYRAMLNAAYPGVRAAGLQLVTAGTAPFGDPGRGGSRIMPVDFWRRVFSKRTNFDILAHHPYGVRGPNVPALNRDDVAVPDVHKLISLVRGARRAGRVTASAATKFWVTELSWDPSPPDPHGIPERRHARWLADAFAVLWRQKVQAIIWFQIRDQTGKPSYAATSQSGVYLTSGEPKLAQRAYAFPFSCRRRGGRTQIWLKAPAPGPVQIRRGTTAVTTLTAPSSRVVAKSIAVRGTLRAVSGETTSLTCRA